MPYCKFGGLFKLHSKRYTSSQFSKHGQMEANSPFGVGKTYRMTKKNLCHLCGFNFVVFLSATKEDILLKKKMKCKKRGQEVHQIKEKKRRKCIKEQAISYSTKSLQSLETINLDALDFDFP